MGRKHTLINSLTPFFITYSDPVCLNLLILCAKLLIMKHGGGNKSNLMCGLDHFGSDINMYHTLELSC